MLSQLAATRSPNFRCYFDDATAKAVRSPAYEGIVPALRTAADGSETSASVAARDPPAPATVSKGYPKT